MSPTSGEGPIVEAAETGNRVLGAPAPRLRCGIARFHRLGAQQRLGTRRGDAALPSPRLARIEGPHELSRESLVITREPGAARTASPGGSCREGDPASDRPASGARRLRGRRPQTPGTRRRGPAMLAWSPHGIAGGGGALELLGSAVGMASAHLLRTENALAFDSAPLGMLALDRFDEVGDPLANLFGREALPTRQRRQGDDLLLPPLRSPPGSHARHGGGRCRRPSGRTKRPSAALHRGEHGPSGRRATAGGSRASAGTRGCVAARFTRTSAGTGPAASSWG